MNSFIDRTFYTSSVSTGVLAELNGEQESYSVFVLKRSGKSLSSITAATNLSFEALLQLLRGSKAPVSLVLNGKGIVHKKINRSNETTPAQYFQKVLPAGNENEFYTQVYYGKTDADFVSVVRKSTADSIMEKFTAAKISVVNFYLGPFCAELAFPLLGHSSSVYEVKVNRYSLKIEEEKIKDITESTDAAEKFTIPGFELDSITLLPFSAAFSYFFSLPSLVSTTAAVAQQRSEYRYKTAFTRFLRTGVGLLLAISLGNALVFSNYFSRQKTLDGELIVYENAMNNYEKLNTEFTSKKDFLEKAGLLMGSKTSFLADRMVYDLPGNIQLSQLQVYPNRNAVERDSVLKFDARKILVKGFCTKSIELNEWVGLIKSKNFIEDVYLDNYSQESQKEPGKFDLTVKLK